MSLHEYLDSGVDLNRPDTIAAYDELPLWSAMAGALLLRHVSLGRGLRVLDVGCGTGFPLIEMAQRLGASCAVFGIDTWRAAIDRARFKARTYDIHNAFVIRADASALPFADGRFDLIVSNLGVNNFADPPGALAECRRVLARNGRLALTTNLRGTMREFYEVFEATLAAIDDSAALERLQRHIDHRATIEGLDRLLSAAGLRRTKTHEELVIMRFTDGAALLRHSFIKLGFLAAWRQVVGSSRERDVFVRLETALDRLAHARGVLELTIPLAYVEAIPIAP